MLLDLFGGISPTHSDAPFDRETEYQIRGLLIDTSRHYLDVDIIKQTIDALSYNKALSFLLEKREIRFVNRFS
jgi:hypothetical protein